MNTTKPERVFVGIPTTFLQHLKMPTHKSTKLNKVEVKYTVSD